MSAVGITVQALLGAPEITALVDRRVYNMVAGTMDQGSDASFSTARAIVYLAGEESLQMLGGPAQWRTSRVSVDCQSAYPHEAQILAEKVIGALEAIHIQEIIGYEATFTKEGSDSTGFGEESSINQRVIDWYVRWRPVA